MNKGEKIYSEIQKKGIMNIEEVASRILRNLEPVIGYIKFPVGYSSINKIYVLLENGYYPWMEKELKKYGYDAAVELQYVMMNIAYGEKIVGFDSLNRTISRFPSVSKIYRGVLEYQLETSVGTIFLASLTRYSKDSKINSFALQYDTRGVCHTAALEFIKKNPECVAVTSLVKNQFGERQYHSYVQTPDGYADFANNIHLSRRDFNKVMEPQVLNEVAGYELAAREKELTSDDLSTDKTLLLRLAVHNQIKNG